MNRDKISFSSPPPFFFFLFFVEVGKKLFQSSIDRWRRDEKSFHLGGKGGAIVAKSRPSLTMMERLIAPLQATRAYRYIVRWRREDKELEGALKNWRASGAQRALNKRCLPRTEKPLPLSGTPLLSFRPITVRITRRANDPEKLPRSGIVRGIIRDALSRHAGEDNFKRRGGRIFEEEKMARITALDLELHCSGKFRWYFSIEKRENLIFL